MQSVKRLIKRQIFGIPVIAIIVFLLAKTCSAQGNNQYYIFVGDSRVVGMEKSLTKKQKENCFFVAQKGIGLEWLKDEGLEEVKEILSTNEKGTYHIIFMLGVNDLKNKKKYLAYYNDVIVEELSSCNLYAVSINPVIEKVLLDHGYKKRTNKDIEEFNALMKSKLSKSFTYLDIYNQLVNKEGYGMIDGLHFIPYTYTRIYELTLKMIKNN